MFIKLILFKVLIHLWGYGLLEAEDVLKCLKIPSEKIRLSCPRGYVLYNPVIVAGASASNDCSPDPSDCIGTTREIKRQTERCFWKKKCVIHFCNVGKINACRNNITDSPGNVTYVIITETNCVPKKIITDMCKKPKQKFDFTMGIIRSHRRYPRQRPRPEVCSITLPIAKTKTLVIDTVSVDGKFPTGLSLQNVLKHGRGHPDISTMGNLMLHGNTSDALKIEVNYRLNRRNLKGFMLAFKAYDTGFLSSVLKWPNSSRQIMKELVWIFDANSTDSMLHWPKSSRSVLKELGWIVEARAVIEQCAATMDGHIRLLCDGDQVIYSPAISLSAYTRRNSKCIFARKYPCGGLSPDLLVQKNLCYWKQNCNITWEKASRIVVSKEIKCIGYSASTVGLSGHRCVNKDKIADLCTNITSPIDASWGIIRSHPLYPWYFNADFSECKRILHVGGRQTMMLIVQDINLDPDGRDKFSIEHVKKAGRRVILGVKSAKEGQYLMVRGGRLVIKFKPLKASKTGRGFVLVFRRFGPSQRVDEKVTGRSERITVPISEALNDPAEVTQIRLSNRRLCSRRRKIGKKGCNRRVWTDYFTRLE